MDKKIAFVFPGQGSQSVGMLDAFGEDKTVQSTLGEAGNSLGFDLSEMIHSGPSELLALTENTQPIMLASAIAIYRAWLAAGGIVPTMMAGHSLGEYTAYVAAGAIGFHDAIPLVKFRAQSMQSAVPVGTGSMAAIVGMSDDAVRQLCATSQSLTGKVVEAVNFNAPSQVVIAGHATAVQRAIVTAKAAGAKRAMLLPVSAPFHSSLLKPAAEVLAGALAKINVSTPTIAVVNNVDVAIEQSPEAIRDALVRQAWHAVRWVEVIQAMKAQGITHIIECGPGKVLSGMVKRIDPELVALSITDPESMQAALDVLAAA